MEEPFFDVDGVEYCDEGAALSALLAAEVLLVGCADYSYSGKPAGTTVTLHVICSDVFAWGGADCEDLPFAEIGPLYKAWKADPKWGPTRWCCLRRNEQPQRPVRESMKKDGAWDEVTEGLGPNFYDAALAREMEKRRAGGSA